MDRMALLRAAPVERARPALVLEAHGPPRNRIHYIIVGDGYTEADLETKYVEHLEAMLESRFTAEYESARPIDSSTPAAMASGELDDHGAVMRRGLIGGALVRIAVMAFGWRAVAPMNAPVVPERTRGGVGARRGTARSGGTGLTLHPEETRLVPFFRPPLGQRRERAKSGSFDLLGFTRYWSKSR